MKEYNKKHTSWVVFVACTWCDLFWSFYVGISVVSRHGGYYLCGCASDLIASIAWRERLSRCCKAVECQSTRLTTGLLEVFSDVFGKGLFFCLIVFFITITTNRWRIIRVGVVINHIDCKGCCELQSSNGYLLWSKSSELSSWSILFHTIVVLLCFHSRQVLKVSLFFT